MSGLNRQLITCTTVLVAAVAVSTYIIDRRIYRSRTYCDLYSVQSDVSEISKALDSLSKRVVAIDRRTMGTVERMLDERENPTPEEAETKAFAEQLLRNRSQDTGSKPAR